MTDPILDDENPVKPKIVPMGLVECAVDEKNGLLNKESEPFSEDESKPKARILYQVLAILPVSFGCFVHGTSVTYPMVAWEGMRNEANPLIANTEKTTLDVAWIISISSIGMIFGSFLAGPLNNAVGRKWTCILGVSAVFALSYTLFVVAVNLGMLYLARFMMGLGLGVSQSISTIYIAEVSTPELRGNLAVIPAMTGCLGVYTCQILSYFLSWRPMSILFAVFNIPLLAMTLFMPESPVYLISKNKIEEAHRVLRHLRGPCWNVTKEINEIRKRNEGSGERAGRISISDCLQPSIYKPVLIAFTLMFFFQMSGVGLILTYAVTIFKEVSSIDKFLATIFLGTALFASNTLTLFLAGKFPRRMMLLASSFGVSVTLGVLGLCYQVMDWERDCVASVTDCVNTTLSSEGGRLTQQITESCFQRNLSSSQPHLQALLEEETVLDISMTQHIKENCSYNLGYLSVVDSMVYIFMFNLGFGSLVWMTVVEILPAQIRSFTNGLAVSWVGILSFVVSFTFPFLLQSSLAGKWAFWMYSAVSFLGFFFIAMFVPETRGKTEDEVKTYFQKKSSDEEEKKNKPILKTMKA